MMRVIGACLLGLAAAGCAESDSEVAKALEAARVDAAAAVEAARGAVGDGVLTELELEMEGGAAVYGIELAVADGVKGVRVDAADGRVLRTEDVDLDAAEADVVAALKAIPAERRVGLADAIRQAGGRVVEVDLEKRGDAVVYVLAVAGADGATREVTVEAGR